ncbi:MAG: hypothetical protein EBR30_30940 [Cytophagia bacterium]|nr:hypothetical protein [Cytophagia bacterium]
MESKHEPKICPRCKTSFICKVGDVANCQCSRIRLSIDEQNHLAEQYGDCLCFSCMKAEQQTFVLQRFYDKLKRLLRIDNHPVE